MYFVYCGGSVGYGPYENKEDARERMHKVFRKKIERKFPDGIDWEKVCETSMRMEYTFRCDYTADGYDDVEVQIVQTFDL